MNRATRSIAIAGLAAYVLLPWYAVEETGLALYPFGEWGTALVLAVSGAWWLAPLALPLLACFVIAFWGWANERSSHWLALCGFAGFAYLIAEGFAIGLHGWNADWLAWLFGTPGPRQQGIGIGALIVATALLLQGCRGLAGKGWCRGDAFIVSSIGVVGVLLAVFVFFPVVKIPHERLHRQ
jgi:iron(III) transport system permease protein